MRALSIFFALLLAACATPQGEQAGAPASTARAAVGERLVFQPPAGWKLGFTDDRPEFRMEEYVPAGQSVDDWTDMITVITFRASAQQPLSFYANGMAQTAVEGCARRPSVGRPQIGDGAYPVMFQMAACPRTKRFGSAEVFMARTIKGRDAAYQVQRAWRMPARETVQELHLPKETLDSAAAYLARTYVCDTRVAAMPCPQ